MAIPSKFIRGGPAGDSRRKNNTSLGFGPRCEGPQEWVQEGDRHSWENYVKAMFRYKNENQKTI